MPALIRQLTADDVGLLEDTMTLFGRAFSEPETYDANRPDADYLRALLGGRHFIALVALRGDRVVGGLAAYVLQKFEQPRSEVHVYDLAVDAGYRRQGIASALLDKLLEIARARGACLAFVQAHQDAASAPAAALYDKYASREPIWHFEIDLASEPGER